MEKKDIILLLNVHLQILLEKESEVLEKMENFGGTERLGTLMVVKLHHQISTFLHLNEHVLAKQYLVADIC